MITLYQEDLYTLRDYIMIYKAVIMLTKKGYFNNNEINDIKPYYYHADSFENFYNLYAFINTTFFSVDYLKRNYLYNENHYNKFLYNACFKTLKQAFKTIRKNIKIKTYYEYPIESLHEGYDEYIYTDMKNLLRGRLIKIKTKKKIDEQEIKFLKNTRENTLLDLCVYLEDDYLCLFIFNPISVDSLYISEIIPEFLYSDDLAFSNLIELQNKFIILLKEKGIISINEYVDWK